VRSSEFPIKVPQVHLAKVRIGQSVTYAEAVRSVEGGVEGNAPSVAVTKGPTVNVTITTWGPHELCFDKSRFLAFVVNWAAKKCTLL
jgi:hypothetical protein